MTERVKPVGVIIAGGGSRRFNEDIGNPSQQRDKFLVTFGKTTLLDHIIIRAKHQISDLILNVNGDLSRVLPYGLDVIPDQFPDAGPLGGVLVAMKAAQDRGYSHIITFSGDTPFFPDDYVVRLVEATSGNETGIVIAGSGGRPHPVMGIWSVSLCNDLAAYLKSGERRVMQWIRQHAHTEVVWDTTTPDPFFNINRPEDLEKAAQYLVLSQND